MMILISVLKLLVAVLIGLFLIALLLLLIVLLVPVRYRIKGSYSEEKADGTVRLSWLLGLLLGEITYCHGIAVSGEFRILGIRICRIEGGLS